MDTLQGKTALVTGASSGIGYAVAEALLARGASVYGLCRQIGRIPEVHILEAPPHVEVGDIVLRSTDQKV